MLRRFMLTLVAALTLSAAATAQDGFKDIFNGKDLTGWKGDSQRWSVKDGAITGTTTNENKLTYNTFLVWEGEVADFELECDYKITGGNSGIQYRSKLFDAEKFIVGGYQADLDFSLQYAGINYEEKGKRGIMAQRGTRTSYSESGEKKEERFAEDADLKKLFKNGDWNHYRVVAKGHTLSHYINGTLMSETIDNDKEHFKAKGILALQIHVGDPMVVQFKNIKLKQ